MTNYDDNKNREDLNEEEHTIDEATETIEETVSEIEEIQKDIEDTEEVIEETIVEPKVQETVINKTEVKEKTVVKPKQTKVKEKSKSRNIILALIVMVLVVWNIFLTYQLFNDKAPENPSGNGNNNNVVQNATYATTDFTKASENGIQKTVGISTDSGSGSGAIYKTEKKGDKTIVTIITNYHVVTNSKTVGVLFANEQTVEGTVLGGDVYTDLAVVQVEVEFSVEAFTLGDSSTLSSGEWVLAIGSPLGFDFSGTVTEGIISGKDRVVGVDLDGDGTNDWDMLVLQTSAAINPGNSGGPLINLNGELIGINSMKIAKNNVEGMGFAIPVNEVIPIVEQLIEKGTVERPLIGLSGRNLSDYSTAHKSYLGLPLDIENGVVVVEVIKDGAAYKAGIKEGDIVVKIGDIDVETFKDFRIGLYQHQSGDEVEVGIIRDGKSETITVTLQ